MCRRRTSRFSAEGWIWWLGDRLHVVLEVRKPTVVFRGPTDEDPRLDNEHPDIHSDGVQLYLVWPGEPPKGYLVVPIPDSSDIRVQPIAGMAANAAEVLGTWNRSAAGYRLELACQAPRTLAPGDRVRFDCLINEMWPDRRRRAGQLVWSGGGDWVWLRGDRQPAELFGELVLE